MTCSKYQRTLPSNINASTLPPDSPAPHLLTTNDPSNKHQSESIDDELEHSRANLRNLGNEIAEAQNHLLGKQAKWAGAPLQNLVDEHASRRIRRLPTELLVRVFMLTLPRRPSLLHPEEAPLVLGQVCRLWRAVSRSTPLLWSTIHIEAIQTEERRVAALEWLERSCHCPLTVTYKLRTDGGLECAILASIAPRIKHLVISMKFEWLAQLFSMDGFNSLDSLQSLHLSDTQFWQNLEVEGITQIDLGTRTPQLADITVDFQVTLQHLILPRTQLTVCILGVEDNTSFALFLQEAVNLVDCSIVIHHFNFDVPPRSPVRHTTLEKLRIEITYDHDNNALGSILPWLDLPSLREFKSRNYGYPQLSKHAPGWPVTVFLDFISRSGCTLSKLWIDSGLKEEYILRYLIEMPSVVDLVVGLWPYHRRPQKLMRALTLGSYSGLDGKDLVPNLERLTIHGGWHECEEMMQAIESRFSAVRDTTNGRRLKSVVLTSALVRYNALGNTQERLDKCVREGLLYEEHDR